VSPQLAAALEAVALRLQAAGVPFLLGGSGLLHALGLPVAVRDLDLVLRPGDEDALRAAAGAWWRSLTREGTALLRSPWKAELAVGGAAVECLGGLAWAEGERTVTMPFRAEGTWRCGGTDVPLAPAAHWLLLYEHHRPDRAAQLAAALAPGAREAARAELGLAPS
jgi:hypothetical protein